MSNIDQITISDSYSPAHQTTDQTTLDVIYDTMKNHLINHVLVVDQEGKLTGIISKEDILLKMMYLSQHSSGASYNEKVLSTTPAQEIMTSDVISIHVDSPMSTAVETICKYNLQALPVVDDGEKALGILYGNGVLKKMI